MGQNPRSSVMPTVQEMPPYVCRDCWYYEPIDADAGSCYGFPPQLAIAADGDPLFFRIQVQAPDRGCVHWKPRHEA